MKKMKYGLLIAGPAILLLFSCIPKKKVDRMESDYLRQLGELRNENYVLGGQVASLQKDSSYLAGANAALLATQDKFLERLDQLEEELDRLYRDATVTAEGLDRRIQDREKEVVRLRELFNQVESLLQSRIDRLDQVARACEVALSPYEGGLWQVENKATACVVSLQEDLLFRTGSTSRFLDTGEKALADLADLIRQFPELVVDVVGHTDNEPVNRQSVDNWDYSVLRASRVAKMLTRNGLGTNQVLAAGKGEFAPSTSNETPQGQFQNRRVELILTFRESDLIRDLNRLLDRVERP